MSNLDLLTKEESAAAATQNWQLCHIYDLASNRWSVGVYGQPSCELAAQFVINQARMGAALAIKALRLIQASHTQGTK